MKKHPLVTVITPTYNRADYVEETLDSVLNQDYPNIEMIVIDDGSSDDTPARLEKYRDRVTIIVRENRGENATVNEGFELANGKYVCVVNSDDPILPGCFSTLVQMLEKNPDALVAYGNWVSIGPNHEFIRHQKLKEYTTENMIGELNFGLGPGTLIRKSAIDTYGPRQAEYRFAGDMEFFLRMSLHGRLIHVPTAFATHREHEDSTSVKSDRFAICREMGDAIHRTIANPSFPLLLARKSNALLAHFHEVGYQFYSETRKEKAHHFIRHHYYTLLTSNKLQAPLRLFRFGSNFFEHPIRKTLAVLTRLVRIFIQTVLYKACDLYFAYKVRHSNLPPIPNKKKRPLLCFSTRFLPPMWSGQSVVIGRLLREIPPDLYRLIGHPVLPTYQDKDDFVGGLPGKYFSLPPVHSRVPLHPTRFHSKPIAGWVLRQIAPILTTVNLVSCSLQRARQIIDILADPNHRPEVLIGCTGDYYDPPATWLAAKILGCRSCLYYFDDYREQWWADRAIMPAIRLIESYIAPRTDFFIAPNEMMRDKIIHNFDRPCHVVLNPMPKNTLPRTMTRFPSNDKSIQLVFTGAVYHLNYSVFRAIIQAIESLGDIDAVLHLYTAQPHDHLRNEGIDGPKVVLHTHAKPDEVVKAQCRADILLIPFKLDPACNELVRTSATAKLADYLATGRPIMAVTTENSFLASFLNDRRAGVVVCTNEPGDIADGIKKITRSAAFRKKMRTSARAFAKAELRPEQQSDVLLSVIKKYVPGTLVKV